MSNPKEEARSTKNKRQVNLGLGGMFFALAMCQFVFAITIYGKGRTPDVMHLSLASSALFFMAAVLMFVAAYKPDRDAPNAAKNEDPLPPASPTA